MTHTVNFRQVIVLRWSHTLGDCIMNHMVTLLLILTYITPYTCLTEMQHITWNSDWAPYKKQRQIILVSLSYSQTFRVLKELYKEEKQSGIGVLQHYHVISQSYVFSLKNAKLSAQRDMNTRLLSIGEIKYRILVLPISILWLNVKTRLLRL